MAKVGCKGERRRQTVKRGRKTDFDDAISLQMCKIALMRECKVAKIA